jgi:hypothetical protein
MVPNHEIWSETMPYDEVMRFMYVPDPSHFLVLRTLTVLSRA